MQLRSVRPVPTLRVSLLGDAKTSHRGFCFPTPVPQQHLRNLPGIATQRHRGRGPVCKPGNTSEEGRGGGLTNKPRIKLHTPDLSLGGPATISGFARSPDPLEICTSFNFALQTRKMHRLPKARRPDRADLCRNKNGV